MQPVLTFLAEEWLDCEEFKPKPQENVIFADKKSEETKHRTEWFAEANKYRCMRCYMKMPGNAQDQNTCRKLWKMQKATPGRSRLGKKNKEAG